AELLAFGGERMAFRPFLFAHAHAKNLSHARRPVRGPRRLPARVPHQALPGAAAGSRRGPRRPEAPRAGRPVGTARPREVERLARPPRPGPRAAPLARGHGPERRRPRAPLRLAAAA